MMVSLNNDMISEVKVQSSNFAAEYGAGGMNVSGVTKAGTSSFHGEGYYYLPRFEVRGQRPVELDRRRREAEGELQVPWLQRRRSDLLRRQLHEEQGQAVLLLRATNGSGRRSTRAAASRARTRQAMKNGDFSELLANRGPNLNSAPQLRIPRRASPGAGKPAPNNTWRRT